MAVLMLIARENHKREQLMRDGDVERANRQGYRPHDVLSVYPDEKCGSGVAPHLAFVRVRGATVAELERYTRPWIENEESLLTFRTKPVEQRRRVWRLDVSRLSPEQRSRLARTRDITISRNRLAQVMFNKRLRKYRVDLSVAELAESDAHEAKVESEATDG